MDVRRVEHRIEELFEISRDPGGGARRLAYSPEEAQAMRLVAGWIEAAGLSPRLDRFGNLWGVPVQGGTFVTSGSHVDTVPNGGRYDGALGTVLALEAADELEGRSGVLVCAAEEAPRFGSGTIGSRQLVGELPDDRLAGMEDSAGVTALEARNEFLGLLSGLPRPDDEELGNLRAHAEVHIEQRRALKESGTSIGIATAVAGPARYRLTFAGETGHSGETRMAERRDALCAAAETVLGVEALARRAGATVATIGTVEVEPNSLTGIPGRVELGLDVRSTDAAESEELVSRVLQRSREASRAREVEVSIRELSRSEPTTLDGRVVELAEKACREANVPARRCVSYAGHDAQHLAGRVPAALLFCASSNGVSHAPEEHVEREDLAAAGKALAALLQELERNYEGEKR
ncbi:MAG: Zn-dependent hydrolase [Rubrobacteraceae bacterium]